MVKKESVRLVATAYSPGYVPQSPKKNLEPWGSESRKRLVTLDKALEMLGSREQRNLSGIRLVMTTPWATMTMTMMMMIGM